MGNSRLVKLALVLGRCQIIAGEDTGGYYYGDYYEPYVSRFAYHALLEFHHQHYPVPKLIESRWRFPYAPTPHRFRLRIAEMLHRIDKMVRRLYVWRLNRAKSIGVRGLNWFYHCPKCGHKLFYSPRTHPCPSCAESVAVVGNPEVTPPIGTSPLSMSCSACGTTENVGEDGLCGDCEEDENKDLAFEDDEGPEDDW